MLVVDDMINVINNELDVEIFFHYYDVFINRKFEAFRITNNQLVRYQFSYDFWHDNDKPNNMEIIINTLIYIELFPAEISNIVYHIFFGKIKHN